MRHREYYVEDLRPLYTALRAFEGTTRKSERKKNTQVDVKHTEVGKHQKEGTDGTPAAVEEPEEVLSNAAGKRALDTNDKYENGTERMRIG